MEASASSLDVGELDRQPFVEHANQHAGNRESDVPGIGQPVRERLADPSVPSFATPNFRSDLTPLSHVSNGACVCADYATFYTLVHGAAVLLIETDSIPAIGPIRIIWFINLDTCGFIAFTRSLRSSLSLVARQAL